MRSEFNQRPKKCKVCGAPIETDVQHFEMDGMFYHAKCFRDFAVTILMEECGAMRHDPPKGSVGWHG